MGRFQDGWGNRLDRASTGDVIFPSVNCRPATTGGVDRGCRCGPAIRQRSGEPMSLHENNPMGLQGSLQGAGTLRFMGRVHPVGYRIFVWRRDQRLLADGGIEGDPDVLLDAYKQPSCTLELETGETIEIVVMHFGSGTGADITVRGPIPSLPGT